MGIKRDIKLEKMSQQQAEQFQILGIHNEIIRARSLTDNLITL